MKPGLISLNSGSYAKRDGKIIGPPDRFRLRKLIDEAHQFPLLDVEQVYCQTIFAQSPEPTSHPFTFVNATSEHAYHSRILHSGNRGKFMPLHKGLPRLVILTSEHFSVKEAALFWNLRASGFWVAWLALPDLEVKWREVFGYIHNGFDRALNGSDFSSGISFCCTDNNHDRLRAIVQNIQDLREGGWATVRIENEDDIVRYDNERPWIWQEQVAIANIGERIQFLPSRPAMAASGMYTITLEWPSLMLPPATPKVHELLASQTIGQGLHGTSRDGVLLGVATSGSPQTRIGNSRFVQLQTACDLPIEMIRVSAQKCVEAIFKTAGYFSFRPSATARYHSVFVERCGSLATAAYYLSSSPYRELLQVLANNQNKTKSGWIIDKPQRRRVMHHFALLNQLGVKISETTDAYFKTDCDILPNEAIDLLRSGLLERGSLCATIERDKNPCAK